MCAHASTRDAPAVCRRPGNLPAELNRFIGRGPELAEVDALMRGARLVTLTGPGGVGKTRLALRAAAAAKDRFHDGVWLVDLSVLRDPELLGHAAAEALGLADRTTRTPREALAEHLAGLESLLVLDTCEHLVEACADLVAELLRRAPRLRVLATSRQPLRVCGEHSFTVPPLPVAQDCGRPVADAVELFVERARAVVPGLTVNDRERARIAELCRRLDGIPLALELAAGRMRALSVEQLLERLDDRFRLLTGGSRSAQPHHRALRTAIGWSHELCSPAERLLWARLSVFAGGFDLEAAEYVCACVELPAQDVLDVVGELVAKSIAVREEGPAGVRYRLLDTVREYGANWLAVTGDAERVQRRHRDWYLGLATWGEVDWFGPRQVEVAARIERDFPNMRVALEYSLTTPDEAHLCQYMAGTLWFYWVGCGRLAEGLHWLTRALEVDGRHYRARAKALWVAGYVAILRGETVRATDLLHECEARALHEGDPVAAAYALHRLGCLALVTDDMARAEELIREALHEYRAMGELNSNVIMAQNELAMAVAFQGRLDEAVALCDDVREVCRDHGERWALAYALYVLGHSAWASGDLPRARALVRECLDISHSFRDLVGIVLAVELLAQVTEGEGHAGEAAVLLGAASRIWNTVGLPLFGCRHFKGPHVLCEQRLRARLGESAYEEAFARGRSLGLDDVVAGAGQRRGGPQRPPDPERAPAADQEGIPAQYGGEPAVSPPTGTAD
ncbi:ATP-binding protein [Wenjunlia tyrosinilytica]|uniref:Uncharacterized protein n=1 Tax=Wenjunlia tyrosinilytica TaxID=1544741 RepID=A0A917ZFG6_9ACTN|nr:tetratricopeptide repeat protein [Wenjunlia tyrosinilytica]GGO82370.1 hypothetical protein GCM10012280_08810 [Wenjunlia tyrosinilytica]